MARRLPLGPRLALAFAAPATVSVLACGAVAYLGTQRVLEEELGRRLCALASVGAGLVPADLAVSLQPGDEDTRTAQNIRRKLESVRIGNSTQRVMLVDRARRVLLDTRGEYKIGDEAERLTLDQVEMERAAGGQPQASVLFEGRDGEQYKSCYARVPGEVELYVVVDGAADLFKTLWSLAVLYGLLSLLALVLLTAVAFAVGRQLARPLFQLSKDVRSVGEGDLSRPITAQSDDEVGQVARALDEMRQRLMARDEERQMMLAGIAHEVRNPLGGMELYAGLLSDAAAELPEESGALRVEIVDAARRIREQLHYLSGVVNDFLAFARDTPPQRKTVDVRGLLEDITRLCTPEAASRGVELVMAATPDALTVQVDEGMVKGALLNLTQNAVQACRAGNRVELGVTVTHPLFQLTVRDNGPGMDSAALDKALTPFFTTKEKGTGLGLPLVVKIARSHGGRLEMKTAPGEGCVASLVLPVVVTEPGFTA